MLGLCCPMVSDTAIPPLAVLITSASQSGCGGCCQRFRLCPDPFQTQFGFVQLFGTLRSPILSPQDPLLGTGQTFLGPLDELGCSATNGELACCCAFLKDASNEDLSAWSFGPKLVSAAYNLVTFMEASARASSGERRERG